MGQEIVCKITTGVRREKATILLESDSLIVRTTPSQKLLFSEIRSLSVAGETLTIETDATRTSFHIGPAAAQWAEKIRNPKTVMQKLGVKPADTVSVLGFGAGPFIDDLRKLTGSISIGRVAENSTVIFFQPADVAELNQLVSLRQKITPDGTIWILRAKGKAGIPETETMRAGRAAGLVDVKVVGFSDTHSAEKFVIPVAKRPR